MTPDDTIVAISSGSAPGARIVVRASGPGVVDLLQHLAIKNTEAGARLTQLHFANLNLPVWVYVFRGPRSFTGEDSVEFHLPGNPIIATLLLHELTSAGARLAGPGEFTSRAYFNGRLDLTEAEGVAATIHAQNELELRAARQLLVGELSRRLQPITDLIAQTLALVEVGIDFTEEDVTFISHTDLLTRTRHADAQLEQLLNEGARFERLSHEPTIVLVGRPNAGKSTLLNALAREDRAVVSDVAGTTRDVIWAHVALARGLVRVVDLAGLDDLTSTPGLPVLSQIESDMQTQAARAIEQADVVVLLRSVLDDRPDPPLLHAPDLIVRTKRDLGDIASSRPVTREIPSPDATTPQPETIFISSRSVDDLDALRARLDALAFGPAGASGSLALNARHVHAIHHTRAALERVMQLSPSAGPELQAVELRDALDHLGTVLGVISPDDVLGKIFSTFCIGK